MRGARALLGGFFKWRLTRAKEAARGEGSDGARAGGEPVTGPLAESTGGELAEARRKVAEKNQALRKTRRRVARRDEEIERLRASLAGWEGTQTKNIRAGNVVWIFGAGRTGSTWLAAMMEEMSGQRVWFEPRVGNVFDPERFERYRGRHFILSTHYKDTWLGSIRTLVLEGAGARFPEVGTEDYLMVKEPSGSVGAPLLMEAFPESRMILLVRDPRDVAASWLDATKKGGWQNERRRKDRRREETLADINPDAFVKNNAEGYLRNVSGAKRAYDAHTGRKALVRYEDLRADTLGTMKRLYAEIGVPVEEEELVHSVEKHSWENIPEKEKGEGRFYRKAKPGGWREDLTEEQAGQVERITAPLLEEFYPDQVS